MGLCLCSLPRHAYGFPLTQAREANRPRDSLLSDDLFTSAGAPGPLKRWAATPQWKPRSDTTRCGRWGLRGNEKER